MITQLSQEQISQYASDAQTIDEPTGTDYSQGVQVGRTIPAKWWNWLFSAATKRITQARDDSQHMLTELQNVVTDAGISLDAADNTQMAQAVATKTTTGIAAYVQNAKALVGTWNDILWSDGYVTRLNVRSKIGDTYHCLVRRGSFTSAAECITLDFVNFKSIYTYNIRESGASYVPAAYTTGVGIIRCNDVDYTCSTEYSVANSRFSIRVRNNDTGSFVYTKSVITSLGSKYAVIFTISNTLYCLVFTEAKGYILAVRTQNSANFVEYTGTTDVDESNSYEYDAGLNCAVEPIRLSGTKYLIGGYILDTSNNSISSLISVPSGYTNLALAHTYKIDATHYIVQPFNGINAANYCLIVAEDGSVVPKDYYTSVRLQRQLGNGFIIKQSTIDYAERTAGLLSFSTDAGDTFSNFPTTWPVISGSTTVAKTGEVRNCMYLRGKYYTSVYITDMSALLLYESDTVSSNSSDYTQVTTRTFSGGVYAVGDDVCMVCPASSEYSTDLGLTWHLGKTTSGESFCSDISDIAGGNLLANGSSVAPLAYVGKYTINRINRVLHHTLYLR